jgi:hypothetical protein
LIIPKQKERARGSLTARVPSFERYLAIAGNLPSKE